MRKSFFYYLLVLLCPFYIMAVPQTNIQPLKVGDSVPNILLTQVGNYKSSTLRLHDFKDRLVILDFWSTWCGACMDAMPHMQTLQAQFSNQIQVLLVNSFEGDSLPKVTAVFKKREARTGMRIILPYSLQQEPLEAYFPHKFVPHYVWILKGRMVAATSGDEVTQQNISAVLEGRQVNMHNKRDAINFDASKPFLVDGNGGDGTGFIARSIITGYVEGIGAGAGRKRDSAGKTYRLYMFNYPPRALLGAAYPAEFLLPASRILVEGADSALFSDPLANDTSRYSNSYCYDLTIPAAPDSLLHQYMGEDLYRIFRVRVKSMRRKMTCLVIKSLGSKKSTEPPRQTGFIPEDFIRPADMKELISILNALPVTTGHPVLDETGHAVPLDFLMPASFSGISCVQTFLEAAGFETMLEEREMDVTIITGG